MYGSSCDALLEVAAQRAGRALRVIVVAARQAVVKEQQRARARGTPPRLAIHGASAQAHFRDVALRQRRRQLREQMPCTRARARRRARRLPRAGRRVHRARPRARAPRRRGSVKRAHGSASATSLASITPAESGRRQPRQPHHALAQLRRQAAQAAPAAARRGPRSPRGSRSAPAARRSAASAVSRPRPCVRCRRRARGSAPPVAASTAAHWRATQRLKRSETSGAVTKSPPRPNLSAAGAVVAEPRGVERELHEALEGQPAARAATCARDQRGERRAVTRLLGATAPAALSARRMPS